MFFSIFAVPALSYSIQELTKSFESIDQMRLDYKWFNAFIEAYKQLNEDELDDEKFNNLDIYIEAQKIFNMPITKSLDEIFKLTMGSFGGSDEED